MNRPSVTALLGAPEGIVVVILLCLSLLMFWAALPKREVWPADLLPKGKLAEMFRPLIPIVGFIWRVLFVIGGVMLLIEAGRILFGIPE